MAVIDELLLLGGVAVGLEVAAVGEEVAVDRVDIGPFFGRKALLLGL